MPTTPHPDYPQDRGTPQGDRCVCGGIRYWHAVAPYGCDDCDCTEFHRYPADERPTEHQQQGEMT